MASTRALLIKPNVNTTRDNNDLFIEGTSKNSATESDYSLQEPSSKSLEECKSRNIDAETDTRKDKMEEDSPENSKESPKRSHQTIDESTIVLDETNY